MKPTLIRTAALALAIPGLAAAAPSFAAPAQHSAAHANSAVWSDMAQDHGRGHHRQYERSRAVTYGNPYGYQQSTYGEPVYANTRVWQGNDGRTYCRRSNGTTGLLIGGAGGALLGREIAGRNGDRTLGAILGAAGGALLGRAIDQGAARCR